jgi:MoaA/NifB/PqqE/SkfB family radical SAM enzyme
VKFHRVYIELSNICGLQCSFCPPQSAPKSIMELDFFEFIIAQVASYTDEVACHVMGDPLALSNLHDYLDLFEKYHLKALLTTSGYFIKQHRVETLLHPAIKQINISLNSFNKNNRGGEVLEGYLEPIFSLIEQKLRGDKEIFINLRLWNLDQAMGERGFNEKIFEAFGRRLGNDLFEGYQSQVHTHIWRIAYKTRFHFDRYFEWPSLDNPYDGDGRCEGLKSHVAILQSGVVVPCCLDSEGVMALGNLHEASLETILTDKRATRIREGFKEGKAVELLCQHCSYKRRFNEK